SLRVCDHYYKNYLCLNAGDTELKTQLHPIPYIGDRAAESANERAALCAAYFEETEEKLVNQQQLIWTKETDAEEVEYEGAAKWTVYCRVTYLSKSAATLLVAIEDFFNQHSRFTERVQHQSVLSISTRRGWVRSSDYKDSAELLIDPKSVNDNWYF